MNLSDSLTCFFEFPYSPEKSIREYLQKRLIDMYGIPPRAYHNMSHIEHCLKELQAYLEDHSTPMTTRIALWYHDVIYDPKRKDNEKRSALWAQDDLALLKAPREYSFAIERLILATRHTKYPLDEEDEKVITDIDLSILGQSPQVYDEYALQIRAEYAHVDDKEYKEGRLIFLRNMLGRSAIYQTAFFNDRYERTARDNMYHETDRLSCLRV
jgi:predicted metal-dependent HD superfamily phosphohydrolase